MNKIFRILFLLLVSVSAFGQMNRLQQTYFPRASQKLFTTAVSSPATTGVVPDESGNGFNAQLKAGPCLTSAGAMVLNFNSLSGVTITSHGGTATTTVVGNTITVGAGTLWNLVLSNGKIFPCFESLSIIIFSSDGLWSATITGETASTIWTTNTQNSYFYSYANDVSRFMYYTLKADVAYCSWQQGYPDTYNGSSEGPTLRETTITEGAIQDFVFKANITTTSTETGGMGIFAMNYTNAANQLAGWGLYVNQAGTTLNLVKYTSNTVTETTTSSTFTAIKNGLPREVAVVKNGTSLKFYLGGTLVSSHTLTSATIIYTTGGTFGQDTHVGRVASIGPWRSGFVYNCQLGAYSSQNETDVQNQVDLSSPVLRWRLNKRILKYGVQVYPEDIVGYYLVPQSSATLIYQFAPFSSGGVYSYPKGHWYANQGYTLDLTNGGANTALSGKESAMVSTDVRTRTSGNFKYYDNFEAKRVWTFTNPTTFTSDQADIIYKQIGYIPSYAKVARAENGQSNSQASNASSTDPAIQYLAKQKAKIYASRRHRYETLDPKVNSVGNITPSDGSIAANVAEAYGFRVEFGGDSTRVIYIKWAKGNTCICNFNSTSWDPSISGQSLDSAKNTITAAINQMITNGTPVNKIYLAGLKWTQGETDITNGSSIHTYYGSKLLLILEALIDQFRSLGVNTSYCVIEVAVVQAANLVASHPQYEDVRNEQIMLGYKWRSNAPTLATKIYDLQFDDLVNTTTFPNDGPGNTVHLNKIGQSAYGDNSWTKVLKDVWRLISPF